MSFLRFLLSAGMIPSAMFLIAISTPVSNTFGQSSGTTGTNNPKGKKTSDDKPTKDEESPEEQTLNAKVKKVIDGDSILVVDDQQLEHEIQLEGIDAPEAKQPYGQESTDALTKKIADAKVRITWAKKDTYGRLLGQVYVGDEHCNLSMIQQGHAWHFKRYNKNQVLADAETEARKKKVGLWGTEDPMAPWDFRSKNKAPDRPSKEGVTGNPPLFGYEFGKSG